jgi:hypothetical protein
MEQEYETKIMKIRNIIFLTFLIATVFSALGLFTSIKYAYADCAPCICVPCYTEEYTNGWNQGCADGQEDNDANVAFHYHYDVSDGSDWSVGYTNGYYEGYEVYSCSGGP